MIWGRSSFEIATPRGPVGVSGWTSKGLGIHRIVRPGFTIEAHPPEVYGLTHLNSGHALFWVKCTIEQAMRVGDALNYVADFSYKGLDGYKATDPDLPLKVQKIAQAFRRFYMPPGSNLKGQDEKVAAEIENHREGKK